MSARPSGPIDHSIIELSVALDADGRRMLSLLLDGDGIRHEWRGTAVLRVPRASAARAEELVEFAGGTGDEVTLDAVLERKGDQGALVVGDVWQRMGAAILDGFLVGLVALPFAFTGLLVIELLVAVHEIVLVAVVGATVGKLAVRLRIRTVTGQRIDVGRATVRWAVKAGIVVLPLLLAAGPNAWLGPALVVVDVVPLLVRSDRRALHDLVAGTVVVRV